MATTLKEILFSVAVKMYSISVLAGFPEFAGLMLAIVTNHLNKGRKRTILCIGRSIFLDDISALAQYGCIYNYITFPLEYLAKIVRKYLPLDVISENEYHDNEKYAYGRSQVYRFIKRMFRVYFIIHPCDAAISGNIGYIAQQELYRYFQETDICGVVLFKEGVALQNTLEQESFSAIFSGRIFLGDLILFYNNAIMKKMVDSQIPGIVPSCSRVVGIPRFDCYRKIGLPQKRNLVLFSFYPRDKFSYFVKDPNCREVLAEMVDSFHREILRFAEHNPNWKVTIKTKVATHYLQYVHSMAGTMFGDQIPGNIIITNNKSAMTLIERASVVVGYNSTTLIEALVAKRKTIVPDFTDIVGDVDWDMFRNYPGLVHPIKHVERLESVIKESKLTNENCHIQRQKFFKNTFANDSILSSIKVENEIQERVKGGRE